MGRNIKFTRKTLSLGHLEQLIELSEQKQMLAGDVLHMCLVDFRKLKILCGLLWKAYDEGEQEEFQRLIEIMGRVV